MKPVSVLFICLGNICRSPTAEAVFTKLVDEAGFGEAIRIDSAGTAGFHVGARPDDRARETARSRGIAMDHLRARQFIPEDAEAFDYLLTMDRSNYEQVMAQCPPAMQERVHMFLDFAPEVAETEVPDPYYGGPEGFENVFDMVEAASRGLLDDIRSRHGLG